MKPIRIFLMASVAFLAIGLVRCAKVAPQANAPDELGNGGDQLPKLFEKARAKAIRIVKAIEKLDPSDFPTSAPGRMDTLVSWYGIHRDDLIADIEATPDYHWVQENPNAACGRTESNANAAIYLSYRQCRDILTERRRGTSSDRRVGSPFRNSR